VKNRFQSLPFKFQVAALHRGAAFKPVAGVVVEKLIQESLIWKAGKVAAAVRYAAVVGLCRLTHDP
jgi:hypothetical protein